MSRAVTVSDQIRVPPKAPAVATSDSGAISAHGVGRSLTVKTQSGEISLSALGAESNINERSGAVSLTGAAGPVAVRTQSSGITLRELRGNLEAHTQSGSVTASFTGPGDVGVETGSGEISLSGVNGIIDNEDGERPHYGQRQGHKGVDLIVHSGAIRLAGGVGRTDSGGHDRLGLACVAGLRVAGTTEKRKAPGDVGRGGPPVQATSRSGSIRITHE